MIQAVVYRITVEPASDITNFNRAYAIRKMWSKLLKVPISSILLVEAVTVAVVNDPPAAVLFNVTDPANTVGNPAGVNTTAAIVNAVQNTRSRRMLAGAPDGSFHHRRLAGMETESDSARLDLLRAAPRIPTAGSTDISFNILNSNKKDATALAATILALTPADIEEGITSTIALLAAAQAPPGSPEYLTRRLQTANASSLLNFTMNVDYSSVQVVELSFVTKIWGVFLDFLLKNIRYVIGGTVGLIVYNVGLAAYHHYLTKRRKQLAEAAAAAAIKAVDDAKRGLKFRILRARFRVLFRKMSRAHKDDKHAAERGEKTAARNAKIAAKAAVFVADEEVSDSAAPPPPPTSAPPPPSSRNPMAQLSQKIGFANADDLYSAGPKVSLLSETPEGASDAALVDSEDVPPPPPPSSTAPQSALNPLAFMNKIGHENAELHLDAKPNTISEGATLTDEAFSSDTLPAGEIKPATPLRDVDNVVEALPLNAADATLTAVLQSSALDAFPPAEAPTLRDDSFYSSPGRAERIAPEMGAAIGEQRDDGASSPALHTRASGSPVAHTGQDDSEAPPPPPTTAPPLHYRPLDNINHIPDVHLVAASEAVLSTRLSLASFDIESDIHNAGETITAAADASALGSTGPMISVRVDNSPPRSPPRVPSPHTERRLSVADPRDSITIANGV